MAPYRVLREEGLRLGRTELSARELSRAEVMGRVKAGNLGLVEASELLELSYRQAKRIWARYRAGGAKTLQHRNCGGRSNRTYDEGASPNITDAFTPLAFSRGLSPATTDGAAAGRSVLARAGTCAQ